MRDLQIKYLLTVEQGAEYAVISMQELKYRAAIRKLRRDGPTSIPKERKIQLLENFDKDSKSVQAYGNLFEYDGNGDPLLYVSILRVCRQIHREAQSILYNQTTFNIDPRVLPTNVPLHRQFSSGWDVTKIRYIRLELFYSKGLAYAGSSRSYGRWSSFLLLPALREVSLLIFGRQSWGFKQT